MNPFIRVRNFEKSGFRYAVSFIQLLRLYAHLLLVFVAVLPFLQTIYQPDQHKGGVLVLALPRNTPTVNLCIGEQIAHRKHFF
jgi:hypothetical protein